ncbi:MAG: flagellar hook-length control protein FliK [Oscillospiraceae bacterium]|jgi:flagellar hook-length control protein FliK|nr:flagellar hook-length control protein FliK [Oscillospiraceae bacterium]
MQTSNFRAINGMISVPKPVNIRTPKLPYQLDSFGDDTFGQAMKNAAEKAAATPRGEHPAQGGATTTQRPSGKRGDSAGRVGGADSERREAPEAPETDDAAAAAVIATTTAPASTDDAAATTSAEEHTGVSVLGGMTTEWSLPGQDGDELTLQLSPSEPRDTARMPETPATDAVLDMTAAVPAAEEPNPCPPENENASVSVTRTAAPTTAIIAPVAAAPEPESERPVSALPEAVPQLTSPDATSGASAADTSETGADSHSDESETPTEPLGAREFGFAPERIAADGALRAASGEISVTADVPRGELIPAMLDRIELMVADGQKSMAISLKPEYLGRVSMTLVSASGGVSVKILADDPGVRSMINSEIAGIIERMSERGIRVVGVELPDTGMGGTELFNHSAFSGGGSDAYERDFASSQALPRAPGSGSISTREITAAAALSPASPSYMPLSTVYGGGYGYELWDDDLAHHVSEAYIA